MTVARPQAVRALGGAVCVLVVAVTAVSLAVGFGAKAWCVRGTVASEPAACYSDIRALYSVDHVNAGGIPYVDHFVEYPVLTGAYMWTAGALADGPGSYLAVSAVGLAAAGLVSAWMLARMAGRRALIWCLAPTFAMTAFLNWDLLAAAAMIAAIFAWRRGRPLWAATWLGVGCALKLFPILLVPALALDRWLAGRRREAVHVVLVALGVAAAANLPFALASPSGWWRTYAYQAHRTENIDAVWWWGIPQVSAHTLDLVVSAATGVSIIAVLAYAVVRARREGGFPVVAIGAATVFVVLAWTKVYSPQYVLWVLPLLVLVWVPSWLIAAFVAVDAAVWVATFPAGYPGLTPHAASFVLEYGVWARTVLLLALAVAAAKSPGDVQDAVGWGASL